MSKTGIVSVVFLLTTTVLASDVDDTGFQHYECYRDLCVSRRQYCSDREQRCKLCQPAHCINKDLTPKECVPLCPDLLTPPTTTAAKKATTLKTLTTTLKPSIAQTSSSSKQDAPNSTKNGSTERKVESKSNERVESSTLATNQNGIFLPLGTIILAGGILLFVLLVLVILIACILCRLKEIQKRLPLNSEETVEKGRIAKTEEEEALLKTGLLANHSSKASGSASTVSSESTKSPSPGPCHQQQQQQQQQEQQQQRQQTSAGAFHTPAGESLPPYTARPSSQLVNADGGQYSGVAPSSAAEVPVDSLQHQKGHNYQLMSGNGYDHVQDVCFRSPPVWERSGCQDGFPFGEETCQKSV